MIDVICLSYNTPSTDLYTELFLETFILSNELHPLNAQLPILVTLLGISMLFNELHPLNAQKPISVTLLGMSMLFNELHPENAQLPILVIP